VAKPHQTASATKKVEDQVFFKLIMLLFLISVKVDVVDHIQAATTLIGG
jgi:hypothetical protein